MSTEIRIAWFSAGITSAVACKIAIELYENVEIYYIETGAAHPDNARFISDCEAWYGKRINIVRNNKGYIDHFDVIEKERYINGPSGAKCTAVLKKAVREYIQQLFSGKTLFDDRVLVNQVFGFEYDRKQVNRAIRFLQQYPSANALFPLIEKGLNKDQCAGMLLSAGIALPAMYILGFSNNNCIGCVKGGKGYWNLIRIHFPETFWKMAREERALGHTCIRGMYLDELDPADGVSVKAVVPECGTFCEVEFADLEDKNLEFVLGGKMNVYDAAKFKAA